MALLRPETRHAVRFGAAAFLRTGAAALAAFVPARYAIRASPSDVLRSR
jgi:hypothetical protein